MIIISLFLEIISLFLVIISLFPGNIFWCTCAEFVRAHSLPRHEQEDNLSSWRIKCINLAKNQLKMCPSDYIQLTGYSSSITSVVRPLAKRSSGKCAPQLLSCWRNCFKSTNHSASGVFINNFNTTTVR